MDYKAQGCQRAVRNRHLNQPDYSGETVYRNIMELQLKGITMIAPISHYVGVA